MKYFIASDIHGSALFCRKLLEAFDREQADRILLLGDLLYHGPRNDLPEGYAPKEVIELLNARKDCILAVRGNCDAEVDQMVLGFPIMADYSLIERNGNFVYMTHGHMHSFQNPPELKKGDLFLQGHTHVPAYENRNGIHFANPGSVSIPKPLPTGEKSWHGYMILEGDQLYWKDLEGSILQKVALGL